MMVIANHKSGNITAIDLSPIFIDIFNINSQKLSLQNRVNGIVALMNNFLFQNEELNLIWSEIAIYNIGFERGINEWYKFFKKGALLAVSEASWFTQERPVEINEFWNNEYSEIYTISNKVTQMQKAGYIPIANFVLPENCWTEHFYAPQVSAQKKFLQKYLGNKNAEKLLENQRHEAKFYDKDKEFHGYVFYIGKKISN